MDSLRDGRVGLGGRDDRSRLKGWEDCARVVVVGSLAA